MTKNDLEKKQSIKNMEINWTQDSIKNRILDNLNDYHVKMDTMNTVQVVYPDELFIYDGDDFIQAVYRTILSRPPDPAGYSANIKLLKEHTPKNYILYSIIKSKEGRNSLSGKRVHNINKIRLKYYIYKSMKTFMKMRFIRTLYDKFLKFYKLVKYM